MPEWSNGAVSKTVDLGDRVLGFESLSLRKLQSPVCQLDIQGFVVSCPKTQHFCCYAHKRAIATQKREAKPPKMPKFRVFYLFIYKSATYIT